VRRLSTLRTLPAQGETTMSSREYLYSDLCKFPLLCVIFVCAIIFCAHPLSAQQMNVPGLPALQVSQGANGTQEYSLSLQILALMTGITLLPSLLLGATAFTRIIIVLSILRQALGTQQTPPNQVLVSIALFLTIFIMYPTLEEIYYDSITPYLEGQMDVISAIEAASATLKEFLVVNTREAELAMFAELAGDQPYSSNEEVPYNVLMPAFITSELKTAFQIGFLLFLPFLVIDMVIASILMSLGMMMLSPMLISLPFKLLLFVIVDGWAMTIGSIASTYMN